MFQQEVVSRPPLLNKRFPHIATKTQHIHIKMM